MWLAEWAAGAAGDTVPTSTIIAGLIALVSAALAAWLGARGTLRTADVQREQAFDKRTDERLNKAEEDRAKAVQERDKAYEARDVAVMEMHRYREQYAALRVGIIEAGLDPDNLPRRGGTG